MRIVILFGTLIISQLLSAQVDTSYQLLWYKGKKLKQNSLLTIKGDTVNYQPNKGIIKVTSKKTAGKSMDNMLTELSRTPRRMQEMLVRLSKSVPKPVLPYYSLSLRRAYSNVQDEYKDALSNMLTLPDVPVNAPTSIAGKGGWTDAFEADPWEEAIKEFRQYYVDHLNDKFDDVPEPPQYNFNYCYACDSEKQDNYNKEMEKFLDKVRGPDNAKALKAFAMARQAEFLLTGEKYRRVMHEVELMINYVFDRMQLRVVNLVNKYIDDPYRCHAVLQLALSTDRQSQLAGLGEPMPPGYMERALAAMVSILDKAIAERDYSIALNLELILSAERQHQLLGLSMGSTLTSALAFNQFKLNMDISAKASGDGGYLLAQVRGDSWYFASPDTNCRLRWFMVGPLLNKTKSDLLALEMKGKAELKYVGTKTWNSDIPSIKIDFCNDRVDSVIAYPFHAENYVELWQFPPPWGAKNVQQGASVLTGCFIDVERTRQEAAELKNNDGAEKLKKQMMAQYEKMMKEYKSGNVVAPKGIWVQDLNQYASSQMLSQQISETLHSINPGRYIFQPTVHNKEKLIFKDKLNGKVLFPENTATEYAWFHMTLEHDPDGPYKVVF